MNDASNEYHKDVRSGIEFTNLPPSAKTSDRKFNRSAGEAFMDTGVDNRKPMKSFKDSDRHSGIVKLKMIFDNPEGEENDEKEDLVCWGSGQIMNLVLADGKLSEMFIQTAAHNFVMYSHKLFYPSKLREYMTPHITE